MPHLSRCSLSLVVLALPLACGRPLAGGSGTETGSSGIESESGDTSPSETETGAPPCDPVECAATCEDERDECDQPMMGSCAAEGECVCEQVEPCPPCFDEDCPLYQTCTGDHGICQYGCAGPIPPIIDPPGSCEIPLVDFPEQFIPFVHLLVDGMEIPYLGDCAEEVDAGWTWLVEGETILLCEKLCPIFEASSEIELSWGVPCE
jgi:hypothetical protein